MKVLNLLVPTAGILLFSCAPPAGEPPDGELTAFVGGRILDGSGGEPIADGVLLVRDGRIEAVGSEAALPVPAGATRVDLAGKTLIPGLINTHGHVGLARGLEQSPEHYTEENLRHQLSLYARYGITTVFSLGGDGEAGIRLRDAQGTPELDRARLFVAGPVVTAETPEEARSKVAELATMGVDLVKIRVDDFLGRVAKMKPEVVGAVLAEADRLELDTAVHLYYLEDAKEVLRRGADILAHSVRDRPIDDELIALLRERDTCLTPTLTRELSTYVYASTPEFFSDPFFTREADPEVLAQLSDPARQAEVAASPGTPIYRQALATASLNLKRLADAGVPIAFGTDSGPPGRFQGYFEHLEMELMAEAGLSPMQILLSATRDAARCLGYEEEIGSLQPGRWADFVVLHQDPLEDIRNGRSIHSVWIAGNRVPERGDHE